MAVINHLLLAFSGFAMLRVFVSVSMYNSLRDSNSNRDFVVLQTEIY